ncbi:MAG: class I SAM-dependent methyltransferase, partial [Thermomicrobiales bacterium]
MDRERAEWFERIYGDAEAAKSRVPWDRGAPHRHLVEWAEREHLDGSGQRAVVVGCGTGDDAAYVASRGFATTAFDIAPTALAMARERFPGAGIAWTVADLFALPADWVGAFDLVVENQTAQALPAAERPAAIMAIASLVASGGHAPRPREPRHRRRGRRRAAVPAPSGRTGSGACCRARCRQARSAFGEWPAALAGDLSSPLSDAA